MNTKNTVGIIGVGNMGGGMARRLLGLGWQVHVRDIDERKTTELQSLGATVQTSPAALAAAVEVRSYSNHSRVNSDPATM